MQKSKRAVRRTILCQLFDHLEEYYGTEWSRDTFVDGQLTLYQIDAILAFKSDARLNELREALDRIEDGSYGICIGCKREIFQEDLDLDPARRICSTCEKEFNATLADTIEWQEQ